MNLNQVMQYLYVREINSGVSSFWDGGFDVWIGDEANGCIARENFEFHELDKAAQWLLDTANEKYGSPGLELTHKGWFCGIVPVYLNMQDEECPLVIERHWSILPLFVVVELVFACCVLIRTLVDDDYEPMFPIKITGEL